MDTKPILPRPILDSLLTDNSTEIVNNKPTTIRKELKRRLDDEATPLPKRLCLAKNVVQSHHFPTAPKERVIAEWLEGLTQKNKLSSKELRDVIGWLNVCDDLTGELKSKLIQVVSQYLQRNPLQNDNVQCILTFLENTKISAQLVLQIDDYLLITVTVLQYLRNDESDNNHLCQRLLNGLVKYYKDCKKKLEFIVKFIDGENLETVFSYLDTECRNTVIHVCQNILFSMNKKSFFVSFLQTLIRKDNIDELMAEKGDNIQSVLKIMSAFFTFPNGRTEKNEKFLSDFIDVFVTCFKNESQLIFAVYVMFINSLNMSQSYLNPAMTMPPIIFQENDEKIKRNIFLKMLEILLKNDVDISVRLTDTFGEKISKVEIKKNFTTLLQATMMGQLKLEGKLDKTTLQIIKTVLKLDPVLIERKLDLILPSIMTAKKNSSNTEAYIETINCLLEILFKLSKGPVFLTEILPHLKLNLEASNTEQFEIKQKIKECADNGTDCEKLKKKVITGNDLLPQACVETYGKLTSELMFRQNKELLVMLQKDFEEHCLMMLEEGFVSPSIITLAEVLSAILSSFLRYNKMADHTVPRQITEDFWSAFKTFEDECLKKFGECILKLNYNPPLLVSFLKLCLSISHLKLLNMKYGNTEIDADINTSEVFDLTVILPCLSSDQWVKVAEKVVDYDAVLVLDNLLLAKTMAIKILTSKNNYQSETISTTKTHLLKQITKNDILNTNNYIAKVLFTDVDKPQAKQLAKNLVKLFLTNPETDVLKSDAISNNRLILNSLMIETAKNITKCFENSDNLSNGLNKSDFDIISFVKDVDMKDYFDKISLKENQDGVLMNCVEILKQLPTHCLEESYQLIAIFTLLLSKKCCQSKKLRKNIDVALQSLYELSPKYPDLYKIFSVNFIFSFEDQMLLQLLTLKIKNSSNMLIIKSVLETGVKKVKTENEIVKNIVELLISKETNRKGDKSSIEYFSDPVFQISCIILPIIAKEKKAITTSAYRSILANLQEILHKSMLDAFKNIDFGSNSSFVLYTTGNIDASVVSENTLATLNAMGAYSLTLSKYCETTNVEEIKNLDCLWSGLEFFVTNAIQSIQSPSTKTLHIDSSVQLLIVILRHTKKLGTHPIFEKKDQIFIQIWKSIIARLLLAYEQGEKRREYLDEIGVTLKFICELSSVECFSNHFVGEIANLSELKKPSQIKEESPSQITAHKVCNYLLSQCLKANIIGPKCVALSKLISKICKNIRLWIQLHYENQDGGFKKETKFKKEELVEQNDDSETEVKIVKVDDDICDLLRVNLDTLSEVILAAKKVSLDYKLLDSIFELQHLIHCIMGRNTVAVRCEISWPAFFTLFDGSMAVLNSLLVSREELLEDRWPNYMQCYRALARCLCERATRAHDTTSEERLAEIAHSVEKLTQSICKRKAHVSRIAAYTVADICTLLELNSPSKMVRQHLENSVALLIQASDSSYAMSFLRRSLAGSPGQMTMTNLYTMYKRYHKYVGNA